MVEPVGLIPLPVHNNNRRGAEIERRDVEELVELFARAFDGDDDLDESGAFSISGIKKLLPIAKIGGSILGIGSDLQSILCVVLHTSLLTLVSDLKLTGGNS